MYIPYNKKYSCLGDVSRPEEEQTWLEKFFSGLGKAALMRSSKEVLDIGIQAGSKELREAAGLSTGVFTRVPSSGISKTSKTPKTVIYGIGAVVILGIVGIVIVAKRKK
ncbi:MAG: hypothetical protein ABII90_03670 [Bacteroidota bacterium]